MNVASRKTKSREVKPAAPASVFAAATSGSRIIVAISRNGPLERQAGLRMTQGF
jgi:hypothetical protein